SATTNKSYGKIAATWIVPPSPTSDDGQILYFFPGLEDMSNVISIVQPVLQWGNNGIFGGRYWLVASWNCCINGTTWYSTTSLKDSAATPLARRASPPDLSCAKDVYPAEKNAARRIRSVAVIHALEAIQDRERPTAHRVLLQPEQSTCEIRTPATAGSTIEFARRTGHEASPGLGSVTAVLKTMQYLLPPETVGGRQEPEHRTRRVSTPVLRRCAIQGTIFFQSYSSRRKGTVGNTLESVQCFFGPCPAFLTQLERRATALT